MKVKIKNFNITNIGPFQNFIWSNSLPNIELNNFNIFYGDNGNGKTTIVKIFKHLNGEFPKLEKNWDFVTEEQSFSYVLEDGIEYDLLSNFKNNFIVFDKNYIKNNVGDVQLSQVV